MEIKDLNSWKKNFTDKFPFIAGITALGYLMAYFHQVGIAIYYGYPEDFIFFDLSTLLRSTAILYLILFLIIAPISIFGVLKLKKAIYLISILMSALVYFLAFGMRNPFTLFNNTSAISFAGISSLLTLPIFYVSLIIRSLESEGADKVKLIARLSLILITGLTLFTVPALIGQMSSFGTATFYELKEKKGFILLSSSGGKMIFGSCVNGKKEFFLSEATESILLTPITSTEEHDKIRDCYFYSKKKER